MSSFGWGILLGGFSMATILAMKQSGISYWWVALVGLLFAIALTAIPDRWVNNVKSASDHDRDYH